MESKNIGSLHVNITGDDSDLQKALNNSEKELNKATQSVREFGTNIGVLRAEYKKLSKESFAGKTPQEIEAIEMKLASLRDEIGDYDARIKSLSADPFQRGAEAVQQLSTMLAGAAGAATLFGGSEEKLNALMQKTIALIAIAQAAQTAADFTKQNAIGIYIKDKFVEIAARIKEGVVIKANTAATVAETGAKTGLTTVQKILIALQNTWNKAMSAAPIMWLIAGIAAITAAVIAVANAYKKHNEEIEIANKKLEQYQNYQKNILENNQLQIDILKARGASEKQLNDAQIKQVQDRLLFLRSEINLIEEGTQKYKNYSKIKEKFGSFENARKQLEVYNKEFEEFSKVYLDLTREGYLLNVKLRSDETKAFNDELAKRKSDYQKFLDDLYNIGYRETNKITIGIDLDLEMPSAEELFGEVDEVAVPLINKYIDVTDEINSAVKSGVADLASGIAESVGTMAAGGMSMGGVFKNIGKMLADFTSSLGKSLIAAGVGGIAFKKLLANPYAAIAAGAALVGLSAVVASKLQAGPSGGGYANTGMSGGGGISGGETSYRTIFANDQPIRLVGELRAEGSVLVASLYNENKRVTS